MSHIQLLPRQLLDLILFSSMKVIFALYLASAGIVDQKYKRKAIVHLSSLLLPFSHGPKPGASPFTHFDDPGSVLGPPEALHRRCLAAREVTLGEQHPHTRFGWAPAAAGEDGAGRAFWGAESGVLRGSFARPLFV